MSKVEHWQLKQRQSLPLEVKISMSKVKIREWHNHWKGQVYVAFSGGKDSTVLLHLVRSMYPDVPAVFCNTGLEYPEIIKFVRQTENVIWLKPKKTFKKVIEEYGYPVISKEVSQKIYEIRTGKSEIQRQRCLHGDYKGNGKLAEKWKFLINAPFKISAKCCYHLKKAPSKKYENFYNNKVFTGMMTSDSRSRTTSYLKTGCNNFEGNRNSSMPLAFWLESDIWNYIKMNSLPYSSIYDIGYERTGCIFCCFGAHLDKINKFQLMKVTHPKLYKYCMENLKIREVLQYCNINYE